MENDKNDEASLEPEIVIVTITPAPVAELVTDPELYQKLSVPYESIAVATEKGNDFYKEILVLREKYNVPEFVIAYSINAKDENGRTIEVQQCGFRGGKSRDNLIMRLLHKVPFGAALVRMLEEYSNAMLD